MSRIEKPRKAGVNSSSFPLTFLTRLRISLRRSWVGYLTYLGRVAKNWIFWAWLMDFPLFPTCWAKWVTVGLVPAMVAHWKNKLEAI